MIHTSFKTAECRELQSIKGVPYPADVKVGQLLTTGPPGSGKSTLVKKIGGWFEEGYIDFAAHGWWRSRMLFFTPREIHLGFPFKGHEDSLVVFEKKWFKATPPLELDLARILIPPAKKKFLPSPDWRNKYVFEFLLLPPEKIFELRKKRSKLETHHIDQWLTFEAVKHQVLIFEQVAQHLHQCGLRIFFREDFEGPPKRFIDIDGNNDRLPVIQPDIRPFQTKPFTMVANFCDYDSLQKGIHLIRGDKIKVRCGEYPIQMTLGEGEYRLQILPENRLDASFDLLQHPLLILNPDQYFTEISGFLRLENNTEFTIGQDDDEQMSIFKYPQTVANRHVAVKRSWNTLTIEDLFSEAGTYIQAYPREEMTRISAARINILRRIQDVYGGPIRLLSKNNALKTLREVNQIMSAEAYRDLDYRGLPGGVIELPMEKTPIIVGDLHAQIDNLLKILSENAFFDSLEQGRAYLVILGDAVHSEIDGQRGNMDTSILMMDLICKLKIRFPEQVFYLRGNHDSFSSDIIKGGIPQGELWGEAVLNQRGKRYYQEMQRLYEQLAYVAISKDFIACHAGPPHVKISMRRLINVHKHKKLRNGLIKNRLRRSSYPDGYTKGDVKRFRKALNFNSKTPLIVSHSPLADKGSVWLNAGKIKNHHIVFSGRRKLLSIICRINNKIKPITYRGEALLDFVST